MREPLRAIDATANNVAAVSRQSNCELENRGDILPHSEWFAVMAMELWRHKVTAHLQFLFLQADPKGYSERTVRAWSSGENELPGRALALLLRTPDGPRILRWIMQRDPPAWWTDLQQAIKGLSVFSG